MKNILALVLILFIFFSFSGIAMANSIIIDYNQIYSSYVQELADLSEDQINELSLSNAKNCLLKRLAFQQTCLMKTKFEPHC